MSEKRVRLRFARCVVHAMFMQVGLALRYRDEWLGNGVTRRGKGASKASLSWREHAVFQPSSIVCSHFKSWYETFGDWRNVPSNVAVAVAGKSIGFAG